MNSDKQKDQLGKRLRAITSDLKLYLEKRIELTMLNIGEAISGLMAASVQRGIGVFLLLGGICFLLFALAIYLGDLFGSRSLGYVLVSLPLLLVGGLFMYLKPESVFKQIQQQFKNEVIKSIEQNGKSAKESLKIEKEAHSKSKEG
ncbi:phage holin family protein [Fodinibius sp. AD559]|uniref:phage holin family protein n=1 Tax=Fodinibius sp. AD559 TaxID=3424179 RepID=UPI004046919D